MRGRHCAGFTYVGLLVAVALLGVFLAEAGVMWRTQAQREREQELLFVGREFRSAIASYYANGRTFPQSLDDLIEDKRWPEPRHHLRRLYADPMTGLPNWTLVGEEGVGITGIASSSQAEPLKKKGFAAEEEEAFADKTCYCDWQFVYAPRFGQRRAGTANPVSD